jgi:hypothetical protein
MIRFSLGGNGSECAEDRSADRYCNASHDAPPYDLANVEANWHGEIEGFTGHVRRWRRKWLRSPDSVHCLLIKSRETRRPDHPARQNFSFPVEGKFEFSRAALAQKPDSFYDAQPAGRFCDAKKRLARQMALAAGATWSRALAALVALSAYRAAWPPQAVEHLHLAREAAARSFLIAFPQPSVAGHLA